MLNRVFTAITAVSLTACAFSPVDVPPVEKHAPKVVLSQLQGVTVEQGMDAARSALQSSGYEVGAYTPELGEVKTKPRQLQVPEWCDCGTWNGSVVQGTADSIMTVVVKPDGDSRVSVAAQHSCANIFFGRNLYGVVTVQQPVQCASRGTVEREFVQKLEAIAKVRAVK